MKNSNQKETCNCKTCKKICSAKINNNELQCSLELATNNLQPSFIKTKTFEAINRIGLLIMSVLFINNFNSNAANKTNTQLFEYDEARIEMELASVDSNAVNIHQKNNSANIVVKNVLAFTLGVFTGPLAPFNYIKSHGATKKEAAYATGSCLVGTALATACIYAFYKAVTNINIDSWTHY